MSTEQVYARTTKRTCLIIRPNGQPCGREYRVEVGSKSKGCPQCALRLDLYPQNGRA